MNSFEQIYFSNLSHRWNIHKLVTSPVSTWKIFEHLILNRGDELGEKEWYYISCHSCVTWDIIKERYSTSVDKSECKWKCKWKWHAQGVTTNENITWKIIEKNLGYFPFDWAIIIEKDIPFSDIEDTIDSPRALSWKWGRISQLKNLTWKDVEKTIGDERYHWWYKKVCRYAKFELDEILPYLKDKRVSIHIDWVINNRYLSWKDIERCLKLMDKNRGCFSPCDKWYHISKHDKITYEIIIKNLSNPDCHWNIAGIFDNPSLTLKQILRLSILLKNKIYDK